MVTDQLAWPPQAADPTPLSDDVTAAKEGWLEPDAIFPSQRGLGVEAEEDQACQRGPGGQPVDLRSALTV